MGWNEDFIKAYVVCALWSSTDDHEKPLDETCGPEDVEETTLAGMREDCLDFIQANENDLLNLDAEQSGQDFWLSRNGHGAGWFDRGLGALGDRLQKASKVYGSYNLWLGDNGKIDGS